MSDKEYRVFTPDDFQDVFNKIFREGYKSHGAGDMWEPSMRPEDIAKRANALMAVELSEGTLEQNQKAFSEWFSQLQYSVNSGRLRAVVAAGRSAMWEKWQELKPWRF